MAFVRLKELRQERKLTQQNIADFTKISRSVLSQYENGIAEPTLSVIIKLADFFNVSADFLIGRTDDFGSLVSSPTVPQLTKEEKKLLENFRSMRPDLKAYFISMSETFVQTPVTETGKNPKKTV